MKSLRLSLFLFVASIASSVAQNKLSGTIIGTELSVDYNTSSSSTTVNTKSNAFDGNLNTYFASYERSLTWVGLDLGTKHVITKVGWSPRNDSYGPKRVRLGVFEGANQADFMDAVPLYMIDQNGTIGQMSYADVNVSRGFRYVRYIGPNDARCNIAEVEFYGTESEGDDSKFYLPSGLPLVIVHVKDNKEPQDKVNDLISIVSIISNDAKTIKTDSATSRLRGNASMSFPKKPYRIKFNSKQKVLDAPAKAKKWTLINNYGDKTLMRNLIAFEMSKKVGLAYTPYGRAVDVIFNGEYKGTYQLCDQVEVAKNRVVIDEMDENCIDGEALTGGYFIEVDAYANQEDSWFETSKKLPVTIKYPADDEILAVQKNYIKSHFQKMEDRIYATNFTDVENGYRPYLDLPSFFRHFIVGELSGNTDTYWSTNMYKFRNDDKFYFGPCWDFDLAFENDNRTYPINNLTDYIYRTKGSSAGSNSYTMAKFVDRIVINDYKAKEELKKLWGTFRDNGSLTPEYFVNFVKDLQEEITPSATLNFYRWDILNTTVHQNPKVYGSYNAEVENVINYIKERFDWMDKKLEYVPGANSISEISAEDSYHINDMIEIYLGTGSLLQRVKSDEFKSENLPSGIYIIKQGSDVKKLLVK